MSTQKNPEYIVNVSRQIMVLVFQIMAKKSMAPKRDAATLLAEITSNDSPYFFKFTRFADELWEETCRVIRRKRMTPEKLGEIISYSLASESEVKNARCKASYRKTCALLTSWPEADAYEWLSRQNGRGILENLAASVVLATFYDYQKVIKIARSEEIGFKEAGEKYLAS